MCWIFNHKWKIIEKHKGAVAFSPDSFDFKSGKTYTNTYILQCKKCGNITRRRIMISKKYN